MLAENVATVLLDLEVASGNDETFTHSPIRNTARMLMQFLPGTDYIFSGYAAEPNYDNMFAGSTHDVDDYDDYLVLQRDLQVDGGLHPVREDEVIAVRNKAARALQAVFEELGLPAITDEEVEAVTYAHGSKDVPEPQRRRGPPGHRRLHEAWHNRSGRGASARQAWIPLKIAEARPRPCSKQKVSGDYLHTSAILDGNFDVLSAVNDPNDYPGAGDRLSPERRAVGAA